MAETRKAEVKVAGKIGFVQYPWAYNQIKLKQAYADVVAQSKSDSTVKVDEETIKANYIARKGLLSEDQKRIIATKRPRSTSNIDR